MLNNLNQYKIILASRSPRRQQLLQMMGLQFEVRTKETDESFPSHLKREQVVMHLALKKALAFEEEIKENELIITADTIVVFGDDVINKPEDRADAIRMLQKLSGNMHEVFTGVCIMSSIKKELLNVRSEVYFKPINISDIEYYIDNFKPYDKAGAYGIQDWFGLICILKINGSFYNVMGMPTKELYDYLQKF
ncbi:MAG TPA: Maf family nucleotide pyrophosphatase [Bacteroidia bacterium]|nr:Maf family nucleotide pyrophosphatase [Bacteroidia bacterium]HNU33172.1 Maf family nucleotide pyrophosphatase [Bacteroidia bacterium]